MGYIDTYRSNFTNIMSDAVANGTPFDQAKTFIEQQFENLSISEEKKADLIAQYMTNMSNSVTQNAMQSALQATDRNLKHTAELELLQSQKSTEDSRKNLLDQQKVTEVEKTAEVTAATTRQDSEVASRTALMDQQKLTEVEKTAEVTAATTRQDSESAAQVSNIEADTSDKEYVTTNIRPEELTKIQEEIDLLESRDAEVKAATTRQDSEVTSRTALMDQQKLTEVEKTAEVKRTIEIKKQDELRAKIHNGDVDIYTYYLPLDKTEFTDLSSMENFYSPSGNESYSINEVARIPDSESPFSNDDVPYDGYYWYIVDADYTYDPITESWEYIQVGYQNVTDHFNSYDGPKKTNWVEYSDGKTKSTTQVDRELVGERTRAAKSDADAKEYNVTHILPEKKTQEENNTYVSTSTKLHKVNAAKHNATKIQNEAAYIKEQDDQLVNEVENNKKIRVLNSIGDLYGTQGAGGLTPSGDMWSYLFNIAAGLAGGTAPSDTAVTKVS